MPRPSVLNNSFFFNLAYKKTVKLHIEICEINCIVLMCCITCVLNLPAVRSQETFPRFSVLTNEQCEYTQYSVI